MEEDIAALRTRITALDGLEGMRCMQLSFEIIIRVLVLGASCKIYSAGIEMGWSKDIFIVAVSLKLCTSPPTTSTAEIQSAKALSRYTYKSISAIDSCNYWVCFWGYPVSEDVQCEWFHEGIPGFRITAASVTIGERCLSQWDGFIWRLSLFALPLRRSSSGFIVVLGTEWWNCWKEKIWQLLDAWSDPSRLWYVMFYGCCLLSPLHLSGPPRCESWTHDKRQWVLANGAP